jgi:protein-tyrosine phosphatase
MIKVLFVCLGNICRSPAAEGIFKKYLSDNKLNEFVTVDSAGTIGYHEGELPDERMSELAAQRGYVLNSRSRKFVPSNDFEEFDYIITMDNYNFADITRLDKNGSYKNKIFKMIEFINDKSVTEVPDPYYGTDNEFNYVIYLLEKGSQNLLKRIQNDIARNNKK